MNNKDFGIVSRKLSNDSKTLELINLANDYLNKKPYSQVCFFNCISDNISNRTIPVLHLSHAKFFYGNLLVTNIKDLDLCYNFPNLNKILFFTDCVPWEKDVRYYRDWEKLFYSTKLEIVAQNQRTYDLFKLCYKEPLIVKERLDYETIQKCL